MDMHAWNRFHHLGVEVLLVLAVCLNKVREDEYDVSYMGGDRGDKRQEETRVIECDMES